MKKIILSLLMLSSSLLLVFNASANELRKKESKESNISYFSFGEGEDVVGDPIDPDDFHPQGLSPGAL